MSDLKRLPDRLHRRVEIHKDLRRRIVFVASRMNVHPTAGLINELIRLVEELPEVEPMTPEEEHAKVLELEEEGERISRERESRTRRAREERAAELLHPTSWKVLELEEEGERTESQGT